MLASETEKLSRRIQRLLDWGRMEAGRKLYDLHPTPPVEIVKSVTDAFSPLRTDDKLVFEAQVDDDLPEVNVDRDAMTDALVNLLSNARKVRRHAADRVDARVSRRAQRRRSRSPTTARASRARSSGASSTSSTASTIASRARAKAAGSASPSSSTSCAHTRAAWSSRAPRARARRSAFSSRPSPNSR